MLSNAMIARHKFMCSQCVLISMLYRQVIRRPSAAMYAPETMHIVIGAKLCLPHVFRCRLWADGKLWCAHAQIPQSLLLPFIAFS